MFEANYGWLGSFTGTGFVEGFDDAGDNIVFSFQVPSTGSYNLRVRYFTWGRQENSVRVNGGSPQTYVFEQTFVDGVASFEDLSNSVNLVAGSNTITISKQWGGLYLDHIEITGEGSGGQDTEAPSIPTGLVASNITQTSVNLNWNASNDNVGVSGYDIWVDGNYVRSSTNTSTTVRNLTCGTSYQLTVIAKDAAGNYSGQSTSLTVRTATCLPIYIEAEEAQLNGVYEASYGWVGAFTGTGFVDGLDQAGDNLTFDLDVSTAGTYNLRIRYFAWSNQDNFIRVNGGAARVQSFTQTYVAGAERFEDLMISVDLNAGPNTVAIEKSWGGIYVDHVELTGAGSLGALSHTTDGDIGDVTIALYPNPVEPSRGFFLDASAPIQTVTIVDVLGREITVDRAMAVGINYVDVALVSGTYQVRLQLENGTISKQILVR